jgi:hypothetical protein
LKRSGQLTAPIPISDLASPNTEQPVERAEGYSSSDKRYETKPSPRRLGTNENQCNKHKPDNGTGNPVDGSDIFAFTVHAETSFVD